MNILKAVNLRKIYGQGETEVRAIDGINLEVEKGEFVAIVGTSGSGKSTLLHIIGGLDNPTSGQVIVDGQNLSHMPDEELTIFRRRNIGFVFQQYNLVPMLNVWENIVLPVKLDGKKIEKGYVNEIIDTLGIRTKLENLPLGKYYVKETGTAYGHVLDGEIRHVDLTYMDQNTPVVVYDKDWQNNRQRVEVSVLKKEKDSDRTLEGAIFGLFAKDDIKSETTGKVLIEANEIIELKSTDEEGKITFVADLPIGATYYVKELYAPDGFVTNDEVKEFTFEYAGENQPTVTYDFTFENQPTVVEFTKSSLTTGKELPGCKLKVVDADGNIVDEWTSGKEAHVIRELTVGKEYALVETKPVDGYVTAESVKFTIKDTADVQKVEMKDDVTKMKISKQDIAGKELPGAKLTILDQDGKVVESWTSTEKAHYIEMLPIGKYTLREETAPDGYLVAKDVEFEVKDTSEVQHVTMVDEEKPAEKTPEGGKPVSDSPKTGDNTNLWLWFMLLGIGATGTGAVAFMRKKKH